MAAAIEPIKISGLREFQRALKEMDGETQKQLKVVLDDAARLVVGGASRRVPARTGAARASLRAQSSQREAKVIGGSAKVPYYGFLDFGGSVGRKKSVKRPFVTSGRYMYPAFAANRDSIYRALQEGIVKVAENVGLEVD
jgi:hypothetical protein